MRAHHWLVVPALVLACDAAETGAPVATSDEDDASAVEAALAKAKDPASKATAPEPKQLNEADAARAKALHDAYHKVCNAQELSGASKLEDPSERAITTANWIKAEVEHEDVLKLLASLPSMPPGGRSETLRTRARLADVTPCPMADDG